jgi:hypothetical protein
MASDTKPVSTLERAYVESKVIKSSLERLAARLGDAEPQLHDDVQACTDRFDAYFRVITKRTREETETSA